MVVSRSVKPFRVAIVALTLVVAACSSGNQTPTPATPTATPATFATPEVAIRAYLAGVAGTNVDVILATCAIDEAAANFNFAAAADRLKVLLLTGPAPAQYPFYAQMNRSYFADRILGQVKMLSYSLLSTGTVDSNPILADGPQASAFAQQVDPARLAGLQVVEIRPVTATIDNDPKYRANATAEAAVYGATNSEQRLALVALGGSDYEVGFTLFQYPSGWKVFLQSASLSSLPSSGAAQQITQTDFEQQTSGS